MKLTTQQKQKLKAKAHGLSPYIFIGQNGLTDSVKNELDRILEDHELIKIRIGEKDRDLRQELFHLACESVGAEPIQMIGGIGIIYRKRKDS
jgi:RNA-binding protein